MSDASPEGLSAEMFDPRRFMKLVRGVGHQAALGLDYRAHGADWAELVLPCAPGLIGTEETGVIASGPIIALMDMAASVSVWIVLGRFRPQATLDLRIDYLRPAVPGRDVIGHGTCDRVTRSVAFVSGVAHDGDPHDPVAYVRGTFMGVE